MVYFLRAYSCNDLDRVSSSGSEKDNVTQMPTCETQEYLQAFAPHWLFPSGLLLVLSSRGFFGGIPASVSGRGAVGNRMTDNEQEPDALYLSPPRKLT